MGNNLNKPKVTANGKSAKGNSLLNAAKNADYVFISVMGPHANETPDEIFKRKSEDVIKFKESFWLSRVNEQFINECRRKLNGEVGYLILVNGKAINTQYSDRATQYSVDKTDWIDIDTNITPVTGQLHKEGTPAYYFDDIELCEDQIDIDDYEDTISLGPIKFGSGHSYSNVFAHKTAAKMSKGMKYHERKIVAVLRLKVPYVFWVR